MKKVKEWSHILRWRTGEANSCERGILSSGCRPFNLMPGCFDMFKIYVVSSHISDIFITGFLSSGRRKSTVKSDCKSLSLRRIRSWYDQGQGNQVSSDLPGLFCMPLHYILIIMVFSSAKSYLLLGARSDCFQFFSNFLRFW